jgi:hypothetical protein
MRRGAPQTAGLGLLVVACASLVVAAFVEARKPSKPPAAMVQDAAGRPLASRDLTLRCGGVVETVRTDAAGGFDLPDGCRDQAELPRVDGLGLAKVTDGRTGPKYEFSPLGTLRFELTDLQGSSLRHVPTEITVYYGIDQVAVVETRDGVAELAGVPLAISPQSIQVYPASRAWRFVSLRARSEASRLVYTVALGPNRAPRPATDDPQGVLVRQPLAHVPFP